MSDTILITGGTGFLGLALARRLRGPARVVLAGRNNEQNRTAALALGSFNTPSRAPISQLLSLANAPPEEELG